MTFNTLGLKLHMAQSVEADRISAEVCGLLNLHWDNVHELRGTWTTKRNGGFYVLILKRSEARTQIDSKYRKAVEQMLCLATNAIIARALHGNSPLVMPYVEVYPAGDSD